MDRGRDAGPSIDRRLDGVEVGSPIQPTSPPITSTAERLLWGNVTKAVTVSKWPVSDLWLEGTDWSVGGSFPMVTGQLLLDGPTS
jgi:hypothetical protein